MCVLKVINNIYKVATYTKSTLRVCIHTHKKCTSRDIVKPLSTYRLQLKVQFYDGHECVLRPRLFCDFIKAIQHGLFEKGFSQT